MGRDEGHAGRDARVRAAPRRTRPTRTSSSPGRSAVASLTTPRRTRSCRTASRSGTGSRPMPRERIHLACVPMDDPDGAAAIVNALQRHAQVVAQKSLAEGFGLTVAEAMYKARPVVGSAVGGIADQIVPGVTGYLVRTRPTSTRSRRRCARCWTILPTRSAWVKRAVSASSSTSSATGTSSAGPSCSWAWASAEDGRPYSALTPSGTRRARGRDRQRAYDCCTHGDLLRWKSRR